MLITCYTNELFRKIGKGTGVILFFILITALPAIGQQEGTIKGRLIDSIGHQSLKDALVNVLAISDSSIKASAIARSDATFKIDHLPLGAYLLQISFQGYKTVYKTIYVSRDSSSPDVGDIYMEIHIADLDSITVADPPMIMKKDTIEFNANSFKTRPYAPLEDLLKKFPGMQVGSDGAITMNGLPIDQLLVDGKPFFNGSTTIATQNLPADIISKVQVYDAAGDQAAFNGFDAGMKKRTINVIIRKNKRKGNFGKIAAGAGNKGTYSAGLNLNHFNGLQQLTVIGQTNNINSSLFNSAQGSAGNPNNNGITRAWTGGGNYRDTWSKSTEAYGSYLYNNQHTETNQRIATTNFLPQDSSTFTNSGVQGVTDNKSQRISFNIEQKIDSSNSLIIRPNLDIRHNISTQTLQSVLTGNTSSDTLYHSAYHSSGSGDGKAASGNLLFSHRFTKDFRTFSLDLTMSKNSMNKSSYNYTQTVHLTPQPYTSNLDLHSVNAAGKTMVSPTFSYTEPIGNHQVMEIVYKYGYTQSSSSNQTFGFNTLTKKYDMPDSLQTNDFTNTYSSHKMMVNYRFGINSYNLIVGTGVQADHLTGDNRTAGEVLKEHYLSMIPSVSLIYNFTPAKNFQVNYSGNPVPLSIQQIQPVTISTDSLYIQKGNPSLKQPYTHSFMLSYTSMQAQKGHLFTAILNSTITVNDIQNSLVQSANGVQTVTPVNVNGSFLLSGNMSYSLPVNILKSNLSLRAEIRYLQTPNLVNNQLNSTKNSTLSQTINWNTHTDMVELAINATSAYNIVTYSLQRNQNADYFTTLISTDISYYWKSWILGSGGYYSFNNNLPQGFKQILPLLSLGITRRLFKNQASELKLTVSDLLNQQSGLSRSVSPYAIQDTRSTVRGRYVMLSFAYNLRQFAGKKIH